MRPLVWAFFFFACLVASGATGFADDPPTTAAALQARIAAATGPVPLNYRETIVATSEGGTTTTHYFRIGSDERTTQDTGPIHEERGRFHGEL